MSELPPQYELFHDLNLVLKFKFRPTLQHVCKSLQRMCKRKKIFSCNFGRKKVKNGEQLLPNEKSEYLLSVFAFSAGF